MHSVGHTEDERTRVTFSRSSCADGTHPWHWYIVIQGGHFYAMSEEGKSTLTESIEDFEKNGRLKFEAAQRLMATLPVHPA
jgi:hypothetical protein